jgi:replicative DNA helicase
MADVKRFSSRGNKKHKVIQKFDSATLDLMCALAISNKDCVTTTQLRNLETLMNSIDKSDYNDDRINKIEFIEKVLDAKLNKKLRDPRLILSYIKGGALQEKLLVDLESFSDLTPEELEWINSTISDALSFYCMDENAKKLITMISKYQSGEYDHKADAMKEFSELISKANSDIRLYDSGFDKNDMFILSRDSEESMRGYYKENSEASNKLRCGMAGLNDMLNGGFESRRTYLFFGLQGEGKSSTLLNLGLQIRRYNPNIVAKDPTKKPCVVMLSMENFNKETAERIWNMTARPENMTDYSEDEYIDILYDVNKPTNIEFIHVSRPPDSENTSFLYSMYDKLYDDGFEPICLIMDYVKVIKPTEYSPELRIALGNVVKEFTAFAKEKGIPVITASQINRDGVRRVDEGRKTNKSDLVSLLGRDTVGESMIMIDFADAVFMIAPEIDYNGDKYLGISRVKGRFRQDGIASIDHLYQPYDKYLPLKLVEDEFTVENAYKNSMKPQVPQNSINGATTIGYGNMQPMNSMPPMNNMQPMQNNVNDYNQLARMIGLPMQQNYNPNPNMVPSPNMQPMQNQFKNETKKLINPLIWID